MARKLPIPNGRLDGALDANGMRIVNLMEPMSGDDAATKSYVDKHSGGGGGGTVDYNDLENKPRINNKELKGEVELTGYDIPVGDGDTRPVGSVCEETITHMDNYGNPHNVTAEQVGTYSRREIIDLLAEKQNALTDEQKAVLNGGPYIGNEGGIIVGDITSAGTITGHALESETSILKGGKEVATEDDVCSVSTKVDDVAKTAAYPMVSVVGGALKDRTINIASSGGSFTFPARTGENARDFVVRVSSSDTAPSITFPSDVNYESDQDDCWTAEAGKANEWYFSESEPGLFKVMHKALAPVAQ